MSHRTILLTGITGFIAKRIALDLLLAGFAVRGSVRADKGRADKGRAEVRAALAPHLPDAALAERLDFVTLDLTSDQGWDKAMVGVDAVIHTASPFPLAQPRDAQALIRPAVDGALRALRAADAAGVARVILTSSTEAIMHGPPGIRTEADWSDLTAPTVSFYTQSKTLAERAAWDYVRDHPGIALTAINPGLVLGRPVDAEFGSSISVVQRIMAGRDPMLPDLMLPVVDVADVSRMHIAALDLRQTVGKRYLCADRFMTMPHMAQVLRAAYPQRRIARWIAPRLALRALALFDPEIRLVLPWIGWQGGLDNSAARRDFDMTFIPAQDALLAAAAFVAAQPVTARAGR